MPTVRVNDIDIYYETQGAGEPLVLIPYLAADQACYAFQVADYAQHYTCITVDLRGAGQTSKPEGAYTTELLADDVAAFLHDRGGARHVTGLSLGAATGMWLAAKHPQKVKTLSLHSAWPKTDPFLRTVVESFQVLAKVLGSVTEMVILGIFPWCFTPELYAAKPEYVDSLAEFVRSRPMPDVDAFLRQSGAAIGHDAAAQLGRITAPTQVTFGRHDLVCSTRFADELTGGSRVRSWWCLRTARTRRSTRTSRPSTTARWRFCSGTRDRGAGPTWGRLRVWCSSDPAKPSSSAQHGCGTVRASRMVARHRCGNARLTAYSLLR